MEFFCLQETEFRRLTGNKNLTSLTILRRRPQKTLQAPPKRPEIDFNYKSSRTLKVDGPCLGRTLRRSAFALPENKALCQQAYFMRCCNQFFTTQLIFVWLDTNDYPGAIPKPINTKLIRQPYIMLRQNLLILSLRSLTSTLSTSLAR